MTKTRRLHYASGLLLTVFIGAHLANHLYSIYGAEAHIAMMNALRRVYRNPVVETILTGAVLVQIFSGIKLIRTARRTAVSRFEKLHVWTGLYLAFFLVIHVAAVFGGRLLLHLDTNFYFGAAGINTFPYSLFFVPYYALAIVSFLGHLAAVHRRRMTWVVLGVSPRSQAVVLVLIGVAVSGMVLFGMTAGFEGVAVPEEYRLP